MNIISWNVRGLGAKIKRSSIRRMVNKKNPSFLLLQETKLEEIDQKLIRTCWTSDDFDWCFSPSVGKSGGILSAWDKKKFILEAKRIEKHWIAIWGEISSNNFRCLVINIYNPCNVDLRCNVWVEISEFWNEMNIPCQIMGDFNEVTSPSDRGSQVASIPGMADFNNFIHSTSLLDIPPTNGKFSWYRGNSKSRLDRAFINPEWLTPYPNLKASLLNRTLSDHCPLFLSSSEKNWGPKPFRFLNCWLSHPSCLKIISNSWTSSQNITIPEKLKRIKTSLKQWNISEFGFIDKHISDLENTIQSLDSAANTRSLEPQNQRKISSPNGFMGMDEKERNFLGSKIKGPMDP